MMGDYILAALAIEVGIIASAMLAVGVSIGYALSWVI